MLLHILKKKVCQNKITQNKILVDIFDNSLYTKTYRDINRKTKKVFKIFYIINSCKPMHASLAKMWKLTYFFSDGELWLKTTGSLTEKISIINRRRHYLCTCFNSLKIFSKNLSSLQAMGVSFVWEEIIVTRSEYSHCENILTFSSTTLMIPLLM